MAAALDQAHVDLHGQHGFAHFLGVGDLQVHAHQRMRACQPRQHFGQRIGADGGAGRHAQAHRHIGRTRGKRLLYASCLLQHAQGLGQQRAAGIVEHQTLAHALEQLHAQTLLQLLQRGTGGRLRERYGLCGSHRGPALSHGAEDLELTQGEMQHDDDSYIRIDNSRLASSPCPQPKTGNQPLQHRLIQSMIESICRSQKAQSTCFIGCSYKNY